MDIKEIAEQVSKRIYVEDGLLLSKFISEKFAEALIESYKAELLKEVGEPVAVTNHAQLGYVTDGMHPDIPLAMWAKETSYSGANIALYTSDQVAAAIIKATKPLEEEIERLNGQISVYRLSFVELERQRDVEMASATRWATGYHELRDQLAAAQEEIERLKATPPDKREDLRCVISDLCHQVRERDAQLAKAEQRVAEACALTYLEDYDLTDIADRVRDGEWRKFVKEV